MARLRVKLKQHTPLIHFQATQDGATLRATELKPKLDRFLLKYVFNPDDFESYDKYLIGYSQGKKEEDYNGKKAFDYKVRIINVKSHRVEEIEKLKIRRNGRLQPETFPLFFGNVGNKETLQTKKEFVWCDGLEIEFFSFHENLITDINKVLPKFFMQNNFGNRQSKGFGSFFIDDSNIFYLNGKEDKYDSDTIAIAKAELEYKFAVELNNNQTELFEIWEHVFRKIELFYNSLRKGLALKIPPYIKLFADSKAVVWDKDAIKQKYFNEKKTNNNLSPMLMKDLFGLSNSENWIQQGVKITKEHSVELDGEKIERFKSPLFFKPLRADDGKYEVYFRANTINPSFLGQKFKIKKDGRGDLELSTPETFDFVEFFNFVFSQEHYPSQVEHIYWEIKRNIEAGEKDG